MLTLIGLFIFVFAEYLFDTKAMGGSTNWSIFYFASTYLAATLIATDLLFRNISKSVSATAISFAIFFIVLMIMELLFINVPFDEYIIGVNENKIRFITYGLLSIVLIFISLMAWERLHSQKLGK